MSSPSRPSLTPLSPNTDALPPFPPYSALTLPLHAWQNQQPPDFALRGGEEDVFFQWCDALECAAAGQCNPSATGVGLPALSRWARWFKSTYVPDAGGACFSTYAYDSPAYTDTSLANAVNRAWMWLTCTELGYFQGALF